MKLKLDENLGQRGAALLREAGHDVATVSEQSLCGSTDRSLIDTCRDEGRGFATLDMDFANPLLFDPRNGPGIAVLRLPRHPTMADLEHAIRQLILALRGDSLEGKLWIVESHRIREHRPKEDLE